MDKISWEEFSKNYIDELKENKKQNLSNLEELDKRKSITLLYGSKGKTQNHAVLLKEFLENF